jgi:hypothetical protein
MVASTAGIGQSTTRNGVSFLPANAPVHSCVHQCEAKYAGEHKATVRAATSI